MTKTNQPHKNSNLLQRSSSLSKLSIEPAQVEHCFGQLIQTIKAGLPFIDEICSSEVSIFDDVLNCRAETITLHYSRENEIVAYLKADKKMLDFY